MKHIKFLIISGIIMANVGFHQLANSQDKSGIQQEGENHVIISIIYDNNPYDPELQTAFGFSCVIRTPTETILFDTGSDSPTLLDNMKKIGIDHGDIDVVVISHKHWDHQGGLAGFLELQPDVDVYIPASFFGELKDEVNDSGAQCIKAGSPVRISDYATTTGELPGPPQEQSLLIFTSKGAVVVTGCAHPGIVNIVKRARELTDEKIYLVTGGFHLSREGHSDIIRITDSLKQLGVENVSPCHCSGDNARQLFQAAFQENYIESGVGKIFEL
jgi:7,8-dihydropterin-6-yl-methyl-4-(beta-D-ribofuranosyl)aminobenzene 5'-phosphate synthase